MTKKAIEKDRKRKAEEAAEYAVCQASKFFSKHAERDAKKHVDLRGQMRRPLENAIPKAMAPVKVAADAAPRVLPPSPKVIPKDARPARDAAEAAPEVRLPPPTARVAKALPAQMGPPRSKETKKQRVKRELEASGGTWVERTTEDMELSARQGQIQRDKNRKLNQSVACLLYTSDAADE